MTLHGPDPELSAKASGWIEQRLQSGAPFGRTATREELDGLLDGETITPAGHGRSEAWRRFEDVVAPANFGLDSPRFLAFIPASPSTSSALMDAIVSIATFSAESWMEASGSVHAENEVLTWLARLAGMPVSAGGCFVSGGSAGNLSALAVAREQHRDRRTVLVADSAHSSVANALRLLDMPARIVETDERGRLTARAVAAAADEATGVVVASAGSTNAGVIDELDALADVCEARTMWLHVDGAYGAAGIVSERLRPRFNGLGRANSFIVDPHKWLFAPLGSCALLYRDPNLAAAVHTQHASYLDTLHTDDEPWNPADYAFHLTRRAAGLPLWFALAVHGVDAHARAVERAVELAEYTVARLNEREGVEVVLEPMLSVVLFRRSGWGIEEWSAWANDLRSAGVALVTPTRWRGEPVGRLVFLNPETTTEIVDEVIARL